MRTQPLLGPVDMLQIHRPHRSVRHSRMNRDLCYPECNIVDKAQVSGEKAEYIAHRLNVLNALPVVNTCPPNSCLLAPHVKQVTLRDQQASLTQIQRENENIVARICDIMRQPTKIDNHKIYERPMSLHFAKRLDDETRTTLHNLLMLKRIQAVKPEISYERFHNDWERSQKLITSIRRYSHDWRDPYYTVEALHPNGRVRSGRDAGLRAAVPRLMINPACMVRPITREELEAAAAGRD